MNYLQGHSNVILQVKGGGILRHVGIPAPAQSALGRMSLASAFVNKNYFSSAFLYALKTL